MTRLSPLLALAAALCACSELPTAGQLEASRPSDQPAAPAFDFANGPDNPGMSGVFRYQDVTFDASTDGTRDMWAFHFQADNSVFCGGPNGLELSDLQLVTNRDDVIRLVSRLVDAPVVIYRLSDWTGNFCTFAPLWVYRGTHSGVSYDNEAAGDGPGANSFGWSAHGTVYDRDGNACQYSERQNALVAPDGSFQGWKNEDIRVVCPGRPD